MGVIDPGLELPETQLRDERCWIDLVNRSPCWKVTMTAREKNQMVGHMSIGRMETRVESLFVI